MKKIILAIFLAFSAFLYAESNFLNEYNYAEYTLENGMQIFVLEDFSSAPVQVEFSVHAGISAQNPATTGFFPLYTRLFKYGAEKNSFLQNLTSECSEDSSNYRISVSQELVSSTFEILARCAFSPFFAEKDILREYSALKNEIMQYAPTPAAFINTAIDSRIFSETPWKLDSGIYPQIFTKSTAAEIRSILSRIGKFWYTPQNSAIFVSGPVKKEEIYTLAEKTFGSYKPAASFALPEKVTATGKTRKFIMHDLQFSEDMTQIVIEYTGLNFNQASLAAVAYNADSSTLKKSLCAEHILNIRGPEYINVSSTRHNGCARLISNAAGAEPALTGRAGGNLYRSNKKKSPETTDSSEYQAAKKILHDNFRKTTANSTNFINSLAYFWAIDPLLPGNDEKEILLAQKLLNQPEKITSTDENSLKTSFKNETPFIFVLVNTKILKNTKATTSDSDMRK
ncbi:MAG: insulinase family protein [Treponema sp.]|nr:MAG: insulinase family protein [Treponema sp.]